MTKCETCGHDIINRYSRGWKHNTKGSYIGNFCEVKGCFCHTPKPVGESL